MKHNFEKYCKDYKNIENYEAANKDNFKGWCCHHRLETHTSDGERRQVDITQAELKALGMYYNRPAEELIFLTTKEHNSLHQKGNKNMLGKHHTKETKNKMSEAKKGNKYALGKSLSVETKKKMSEAKKNMSEETRKKMSEAKKGTIWYNNGKISKRAKDCLPGFVPGRLRK